MLKGGTIGFRGTYKITVFRGDGIREYEDCPQEHMEGQNLVPDAGTEEFAKILLAEASSTMAYMAVGSGGGAPDMGETTLVDEQARKILSLNASSVNFMVQVATFGGQADTLTGIQLNEVGIFNDDTAGEMGSRISISTSPITLAASDLVRFQVETEVGSHS